VADAQPTDQNGHSLLVVDVVGLWDYLRNASQLDAVRITRVRNFRKCILIERLAYDLEFELAWARPMARLKHLSRDRRKLAEINGCRAA